MGNPCKQKKRRSASVLFQIHCAIFVTAGADSSPNSWDLLQTARVLQLHRNTVDNRIKKTEQLFGVDLKNARTRRKLSLALDAGL